MGVYKVSKVTGGPGVYAFGDEEKKEVMDVLEGGYVFRYGDENNPNFKRKVMTLEKEFAEYIGTKYSIAVNSGSSALIDCMSTLGIGPGDEVLVPGYTFVATVGTTILSNAIPVLVEVDESLTMDPKDIEKKITPKTKAIIPVHMLGNVCDMEPIMKIAKAHNLLVIEDCCQSAGASYHGKKVGTFGDMGAFSLNHFKTINCGDGGMVVVNDDLRYEIAFGVHDQGHKPLRTGSEVGERALVGYNMRMNELQGAYALAQLRKLDRVCNELRRKKTMFKEEIKKQLPNLKFRRINDEKGECGTILTVLFETAEIAEKVGTKLGMKTVSNSGWHVYNNWEHILEQKTHTEIKCPWVCPFYGKEIEYKKHMLPQTDSILTRALNFSVGVIDNGLGTSYGIHLNSKDEDIFKVVEGIRDAYNSI